MRFAVAGRSKLSFKMGGGLYVFQTNPWGTTHRTSLCLNCILKKPNFFFLTCRILLNDRTILIN